MQKLSADSRVSDTMTTLTPASASRFRKKVVKRSNGCWEWQAALVRGGYGLFRLDDRMKYAHRVAYEMKRGPIPNGLTIDHLCRNRRCVNPDHLEAVTMRENLMRGNTAAARNSRKTQCPRGHLYEGENLLVHNGKRSCRTCGRKHSLAWWRRNRKTS